MTEGRAQRFTPFLVFFPFKWPAICNFTNRSLCKLQGSSIVLSNSTFDVSNQNHKLEIKGHLYNITQTGISERKMYSPGPT